MGYTSVAEIAPVSSTEILNFLLEPSVEELMITSFLDTWSLPPFILHSITARPVVFSPLAGLFPSYSQALGNFALLRGACHFPRHDPSNATRSPLSTAMASSFVSAIWSRRRSPSPSPLASRRSRASVLQLASLVEHRVEPPPPRRFRQPCRAAVPRDGRLHVLHPCVPLGRAMAVSAVSTLLLDPR